MTTIHLAKKRRGQWETACLDYGISLGPRRAWKEATLDPSKVTCARCRRWHMPRSPEDHRDDLQRIVCKLIATHGVEAIREVLAAPAYDYVKRGLRSGYLVPK
jgi:hypothetical protein